MSGLADVVVTLGISSPASLARLRALPSAAGTINLRADLAGDIDAAHIHQHCACRLIYSLRSHAQGGVSNDSDDIRHRRLLAAARHFDIVELEAERDMVPQLLAAIAPSGWSRFSVPASSRC